MFFPQKNAGKKTVIHHGSIQKKNHNKFQIDQQKISSTAGHKLASPQRLGKEPHGPQKGGYPRYFMGCK